MIFGSTYSERVKKQQDGLEKNYLKIFSGFAFIPLQLYNGKWMWFGRFYYVKNIIKHSNDSFGNGLRGYGVPYYSSKEELEEICKQIRRNENE